MARVLVWLVAALLLTGLGLGAAGYWLTGSESGALLLLGLLEKTTAVHIQGVSGSLRHDLQIRHLDLQGPRYEFSADDISLQWQSGLLWHGRLKLDRLQIGRVQLALARSSAASASLPNSLVLPQVLQNIELDQLVLRQFELSTLEAGHGRSHVQHFSALNATLALHGSQAQVKLNGTTPWGTAALDGSISVLSPFALHSTLAWQGLPITEKALVLPGSRLKGTASGSLAQLIMDANIEAEPGPLTSGGKPVSVSASGRVHAVLTPFAILPLASVQLALNDINPATLYLGAPQALLAVQADLKAANVSGKPVLLGHVQTRNSKPQAWNVGGIPATGLRADLTLSEQKIVWQAGQLQLEQGGSAVTDGELVFPAASPADPGLAAVPQPLPAVDVSARLPVLKARLQLTHVNPLLIDNRLRKTNLDGLIEIQPNGTALRLGLHLNEAGEGQNSRILAELSLDPALLLTLEQLELSARDAQLTAHGTLALQQLQQFSLVGQAQHFNPARWLAVPDGRIDSRFKLAGQLSQGWRVDAGIESLAGQFAGLSLSGTADLHARQNQALDIQHLDLNWGKNHLSAQGQWQFNPGPQARQHLQFSLALPDLAAASRPFAKVLPVQLQGSLMVSGNLAGNVTQPSGHLMIQASALAIPDLMHADHVDADLQLGEGEQGSLQGHVDISGLAIGADQPGQARFKILTLQASLRGQRHAHDLRMALGLPRQQLLTLQAHGDLQQPAVAGSKALNWLGQVQALDLAGPVDFQLQAPFRLQLSSQLVQLGLARWRGKLGGLQITQLKWTPEQLSSAGQFEAIAVVPLIKLWHEDAAVEGTLLLDANWQFGLGQQVSGTLHVQRRSGDIVLQDSAAAQTKHLALGLHQLALDAKIIDPVRAGIMIELRSQGDQLGQISATLGSNLQRHDGGWILAHDAPLQGHAELKINDIRWMSQLLGPGISLGGAMQAQAQLSGQLDAPGYRASLSGRGLQVSFTELGILLPNGTLDAVIEDHQLKLTAMKFSQTIKPPPRHDQLNDLGWLKQTGQFEASGALDLSTGQGSITASWQKFPFLQSPESWLVASGQAQLAETGKVWNLNGRLIADAAYFSVPKQAAPRLSSDVVVLKKNAKRDQVKTPGLQTSLDFSIGMGQRFIFVGRGLNTRLDGDLRLRSKNGAAVLATGTIQTDGGSYEGYGQQLAIERGILNFQGQVDNPGLNVRAIRRGLQVEAGVEVVGTVLRPEVHLISEPTVPDPDKLSWMVLGRASDQMSGSETGALMSAASAIFGSDSGGGLPANIAHRLGLEGLSFGTTGNSPESSLPLQTVAGSITSVPADQVFSVGKRLSPNIVLSIERSLTDASNGLKLTWHLTRRFSIIGRAGNDTAIDGQYTFSFD